MARFRDIKTLQKFAAGNVSIHNHFNLERHLNRRETFKENRTGVGRMASAGGVRSASFGDSETGSH